MARTQNPKRGSLRELTDAGLAADDLINIAKGMGMVEGAVVKGLDTIYVIQSLSVDEKTASLACKADKRRKAEIGLQKLVDLFKVEDDTHELVRRYVERARKHECALHAFATHTDTL